MAGAAANKATTPLPTQYLAAPIRALAMDAVQAANSGHPGMPMGFADVATVLYRDFLSFSATHPTWPNRDRFILSAGHGSMLLYALAYLTGYAGMPLEEIKNFRQLGSHTAGHPEFNPDLGIETTTGPLGQGFANAVGMALAERILNTEFGDIINHYTYVAVGDGCLMEGISYEAASMAGHWQLGKLIALFDDNGISIDGSTSLSTSEDQCARFKACGWDVWQIDGHNPEAIAAAIAEARTTAKPSFIACKTIIGYGAPTKAGTAGCHGSPLGDTEIAATRTAINWPYEPFVIPDDCLQAWRAIGQQGTATAQRWQQQLARHPQRAELERRLQGTLPTAVAEAFAAYKAAVRQTAKPAATRKSSGDMLDMLVPAMPELLGGSADLTGSVNTRAKAATTALTAENYSGSYVHYGIREHAMAAAMNGLALHGGIVPFGGTFLVFADYCKPSVRLAALMQQRCIFVFTHDSIGLGEDGPTHQPIEHLAMLRAIPHLQVLRPADAIEVAECWELALTANAPTALVLTRQNVPLLRTETDTKNLSRFGAYLLREPQTRQDVSLIATGSEVSLAVKVQAWLSEHSIDAGVISMPSQAHFDQQPQHYRDAVLPPGSLNVAIEAASPFGWHKYTGSNGLICAIDSFGASAPAEALYEHFGLTPAVIGEKIRKHLTTRKPLA